MRSFVKNVLVWSLAAVFGPLTSGYPIVLALCGSGDGGATICRMSDCQNEDPTGPAVSGPTCCTPHVVADGVSKVYVKPQVPTQEVVVAPYSALSFTIDADQECDPQPLVLLSPSVHAPPLYLSHRSLLI